jgi:DNA repair protein RadC
MIRKAMKRIPVYHLELVRDRTIKAEVEENVNGTAAAARILAREMAGADRERLLCLWLNCRNDLIGLEVVSVGTLTASLAHSREIFKGAILANAANIVLAHNHPSGNPSPSAEDIQLTRRLAEAGRLLGIQLLDHLIVTEKETYSFKAAGTL